MQHLRGWTGSVHLSVDKKLKSPPPVVDGFDVTLCTSSVLVETLLNRRPRTLISPEDKGYSDACINLEYKV